MKRLMLAVILFILIRPPSFGQVGIASWYGPGYHGRPMANGKSFNQYAMTMACNHIKLGTMVRITNLNNGLSALVEVTDRGPFVKGRLFDVAFAVAVTLDFHREGLAKVKIDVIK